MSQDVPQKPKKKTHHVQAWCEGDDVEILIAADSDIPKIVRDAIRSAAVKIRGGLSSEDLAALPQYRYTNSNPGFSRAYYRSRTNVQAALVCIQHEYADVYIAYACTKDGEPSHPLVMMSSENPPWEEFDLPTGDSAIDIRLRDFLKLKTGRR